MTTCSDLTLTEALSDPIIGAMMDADGVDRDELETSLLSLAQRIESKDEERPHLCCE